MPYKQVIEKGPWMFVGTKVTVVKPGVFHLATQTRLQWKEGEVVKVVNTGRPEIHVKFPPGTLRGCLKGSPVLHLSPDVIIPTQFVEAYKSGMAKLTEDEKWALRV